MYGSPGVGVLGFVLIIAVIVILSRTWRSRRSPQLTDILRSGLLPMKKFRPALRHNLTQIEDALPLLTAQKFGGKQLNQPGSAGAARMVDLQARLEQVEFRCAQLTQQNAELNRALARAETLRQNMSDIAKAAIKSAGVAVTVTAYVPSLAADAHEAYEDHTGSAAELGQTAVKG